MSNQLVLVNKKPVAVFQGQKQEAIQGIMLIAEKYDTTTSGIEFVTINEVESERIDLPNFVITTQLVLIELL